MARKGKLSQALAKQINHDRLKQLKKQKIKNRIENFDLKPKQPLQKREPFIPFAPEDKIMLIGEGDFSFARSIIECKYILNDNLVATSFDSYDDLLNKYPQTAQQNIQFLKDNGVRVYHNIDATNLNKSLGIQGGNKRQGNGSGKTVEVLGSLKLNNIIFNFPHVGKGIKNVERNIKANQELMVKFFQSARILYDILYFQRDQTVGKQTELTSMSVEEAEWMYLNQKKFKDTDGGKNDVDVITVTLFESEPYNSWQVKRLAKESIGYQVQKSNPFNWASFPDYHHRRTAGEGDTNKAANKRNARIYKFEKYNHTNKKDKKKQQDSDSE